MGSIEGWPVKEVSTEEEVSALKQRRIDFVHTTCMDFYSEYGYEEGKKINMTEAEALRTLGVIKRMTPKNVSAERFNKRDECEKAQPQKKVPGSVGRRSGGGTYGTPRSTPPSIQALGKFGESTTASSSASSSSASKAPPSRRRPWDDDTEGNEDSRQRIA